MNKLLKLTKVKVNNIPREVAVRIQGPLMYGVINKTKFIWEYTKYTLPRVNVADKQSALKAAKYGRLFILKRLEMEGVKLNIKTTAPKVKYINIPAQDGVWMNVFENGYIRGCVDGQPFAWNPKQYKQAVAVNVAGFNGNITQKIDTNRIKARLKAAGYTSLNKLLAAVSGSTTPTPVITKSVEIVKTEEVTVHAHNNGDVTGIVNGEEFAWNYKKNKADELHELVRAVIKTVAPTPKALVKYVNEQVAKQYAAEEQQAV